MAMNQPHPSARRECSVSVDSSKNTSSLFRFPEEILAIVCLNGGQGDTTEALPIIIIAYSFWEAVVRENFGDGEIFHLAFRKEKRQIVEIIA